MDNDREIRTTLLKILRVGLLRIRALANDGSAHECSVEADHLHNIPELVESLRPAEILYYFDVEIPGFLRSTTTDSQEFKPLWDQLAPLIGREVK